MNIRSYFLTILSLAAISTATAQNCIEPCGESESIEGSFFVVALRRSSTVSGGPDDSSAADWLGREIVFDHTLSWIDGQLCEDWRILKVDEPINYISDPNLSDLEIEPVDSASSNGDARRTVLWNVICENKSLGYVLEIDRRVLVINSNSGLTYAILEKPLNRDQVMTLQQQLADMKFYEGDINGELDDTTARAVSAYAEYRGAEFRFYRAAITENLLDGLGVLTD